MYCKNDKKLMWLIFNGGCSFTHRLNRILTLVNNNIRLDLIKFHIKCDVICNIYNLVTLRKLIKYYIFYYNIITILMRFNHDFVISHLLILG